MAKHPKYFTDQATFNKEWDRLVKLRDETKARRDEMVELIDLLEANKDLPDDVEENISILKTEAANLSTILTSASTYVSSIKTYYENWNETKDKIDTEYEEAQDQNKTISGFVEDATKLKDTLDNELKRSRDLLDDVTKTLSIATDGAISSVFKARSDDRKKSRQKWGWVVFAYIIVFAVALWFIISEVASSISDGNQLSVWIMKLAIIIPFVYFLYFVIRQYNRERDLEEKYAFKALVSQTIQNNTKLLKDEFLEAKDEEVKSRIVDFVVRNMDAVYKEPFSKSFFESRVGFSLRKPKIEAKVKNNEE